MKTARGTGRTTPLIDQQMAGVLRERGLEGSAFPTQGTRSRVMETLASGQALPLGVVRVEGTVMHAGPARQHGRRQWELLDGPSGVARPMRMESPPSRSLPAGTP